MRKKQLTIMGTVWDFWPILKLFGRLYESKFISFYEPWLKGEIDKDKIILFNEKEWPKFLFPFKIFKLLTRTYRIMKVIQEYKPDVVITHHDDANMSVLPSLFIAKKILRKNIKFICWIHAGTEYYSTGGMRNHLITFLIRNFYRQFNKIVTVSEGNKLELEKKFKLDSIEVIYNPVNVKKYLEKAEEPLEKKFLELFRDSFVFLNIGRLTEQKAHWYLIRTFKKVVEKHDDAKLIILGGGELRNRLEELIEKLNLTNNVFLLGNQDNVFNFLKQSKCFVLSSLWEGLSQVLVESMVVNLPIISTDCKSGSRESLCPEIGLDKKINYPYFGKYGILTKPFKREFVFKTLEERPLSEEENILADLMIKMIEDRKLREKYSNGLERAKDFDLDKISIKIENLIVTIQPPPSISKIFFVALEGRSASER